jgi:hypothetical protein
VVGIKALGKDLGGYQEAGKRKVVKQVIQY